MKSELFDKTLDDYTLIVYSISKYLSIFRGNVFQFILDKLVAKLVMPAGNCTVWNMESSLMVKCPQTKLLEQEMIHLTPSSLKLELASMYPELSL